MKIKVDVPENHSYASIDCEGEDEVSTEKNKLILQQEVMKTKPKGDLRDLVTGTFPHRRQWILSNCLPLKDIVSQFPHLPKPSYVSDC